VRGTLYGGCLSILLALLGTAFEPQTEGKILFLEDVSTKPFQIDRMLWQLKQAEKLDGVKAIIFGEMLDCTSPGARPELLEEVILNALEDFDGPIAIGLRSGHVSRANVTLTLGVEAEFTATHDPELRLLEPAVAR
jgi:muramoyltetrapeptide carboxypeptidase